MIEDLSVVLRADKSKIPPLSPYRSVLNDSISLSYPSEVSAEDTIMLFSVPRGMKLIIDPIMYSGKSLIPAANQSIFSIKKNKGEIGTITFNANMSTPTFDIYEETFFAQNDVLSIDAPSDPPHGGICLSMKAILTTEDPIIL